MSEKIRDLGLGEATKLRNELINPFDPKCDAMGNYGKFIHLKEALTHKYTVRLIDLAGARIQALREKQAADIGQGILIEKRHLVPQKDIDIVNRFLMNICSPLHKLIGSTLDPEVCDRMEESLRLWLGDEAFVAIMTELNQEVLLRAREMPQRTEDDLTESIAEHRRLLLAKLGEPPAAV